ncbi:MAG TPA: DUF3575 domain-containing protein [Kofleriaceae bacterium]|nr:DUF3575 domain-containing protein [Kofleriaceae bacterium]
MRALLVLVLLTGAAHAEPDVIATQPLALAANGVSASYERPLTTKLSGVAIAGYRDGADGDFDANTFTGGAELRRWFRDDGRMRGPFIGVHVSVGHTRLSDQMGYVGSSTSFTQRLEFGWRFVIRNHVTIAPAIGIAIHEDISGTGNLAPIGHAMPGLGLELGWMR